MCADHNISSCLHCLVIVYQKFLKLVLDHTDEFADIRGLLDRWKTLSSNAGFLDAASHAKRAENKKEKAHLQKLSEV